jgi:hypothetical protein
MANISASDVKALREKTGAGMMECKNALVETDGDFAKAEKLLKEKGLAAVEKRAGRATNEGKIFVKIKDSGIQGSTAVLVELVSETDFVARNPDFIALGGAIADKILEKSYTEPNDELNGMVSDLATKIRENMSLKRIRIVKARLGNTWKVTFTVTAPSALWSKLPPISRRFFRKRRPGSSSTTSPSTSRLSILWPWTGPRLTRPSSRSRKKFSANRWNRMKRCRASLPTSSITYSRVKSTSTLPISVFWNRAT